MWEKLFSLRKSKVIRLVSVDLGVRAVQVPVAVIEGNRPGATLVVTGGMDGDEYAGMEAAYALISHYEAGDFAGRLVVLPIVNVPGFERECSANPLDGRFPKFFFPGKADGSPTERLIDWFASTYLAGANCWYDLHGGAITEGLQPFLWLYKTDVVAVDVFAKRLQEASIAESFMFEHSRFVGKAAYLARKGCVYVLAESGARGGRAEEDVARHMRWLHATMTLLGMIDTPMPEPVAQHVMTNARYIVAPFAGIWRPSTLGQLVHHGDMLGTCSRIDGSDVRVMQASASGRRLWWKETMQMQKGDVLCAIGA